jgi:hypothetical protein
MMRTNGAKNIMACKSGSATGFWIASEKPLFFGCLHRVGKKTGYKIVDRYAGCGLEGLTDRARRPYRCATPRRQDPQSATVRDTVRGLLKLKPTKDMPRPGATKSKKKTAPKKKRG